VPLFERLNLQPTWLLPPSLRLLLDSYSFTSVTHAATRQHQPPQRPGLPFSFLTTGLQLSPARTRPRLSEPSHRIGLHSPHLTMADINDDSLVGDSPANPGRDVEMAEGLGEDETTVVPGRSEIVNDGGAEEEPASERTSFISYLTSPVVTLIVGEGENETILTAHQALLALSPFFKEACAQFSDDGSVSVVAAPRGPSRPGPDGQWSSRIPFQGSLTRPRRLAPSSPARSSSPQTIWMRSAAS
jgi:hypothetical protein